MSFYDRIDETRKSVKRRMEGYLREHLERFDPQPPTPEYETAVFVRCPEPACDWECRSDMFAWAMDDYRDHYHELHGGPS